MYSSSGNTGIVSETGARLGGEYSRAEAPAPIGQEAQPATDGGSPLSVGGVGQSKLGRKKSTPSGSKCRVPPAPITGPLKSPAPREYQAPCRANVNWFTIVPHSFQNGAGSGPGPRCSGGVDDENLK
jgi:hypothetical protein